MSSSSSDSSQSSSSDKVDTDNDGIPDYVDVSPTTRKIYVGWAVAGGKTWYNINTGWTSSIGSHSWLMDDKNNENGFKTFGNGHHGAAFTGFDPTIGTTLGGVLTGGQKVNDAAPSYTWTDIFYELGMRNANGWYAVNPEPVSGYLAQDFKDAPWKFFTANGTGNLGHTNATHIDLGLYWEGSSDIVPIPIANIHRTNDQFVGNGSNIGYTLWVRYSTDANNNIIF